MTMKFQVIGLVAMLGACSSDEDVQQFRFEVTGVGVEDGCNEPTVGYQDTWEFRLAFPEGNSFVELNIDDQTFATGSINGCTIEYESVVWGEIVDGFNIRWQLSGSALFELGGEGCGLETGKDWLGTETFTVVSTGDGDQKHPSIEPGCEYILDTEGAYLGLLE